MRKVLRVIGVLWVVGVFGFMAYDFTFYAPEAKRAMQALEVEASVVNPPPHSHVSRSATHKTRSALVSYTYSTSTEMSYPELRTYYDAQLVAHGWTFVREQSDRAWGKDLGGTSAYYRKGAYTARLQFAGAKANYDWTYSLDYSWGMHSSD